MTKFKVGDKVRVAVSEEFVPKGTILTVTKGPVGSARGGNYYFEGYPQTDNYCVLGGDLALVSDKPTKNQRITTLEQNVVSLESEVAELKAKVEALEKAQNKPPFTHINQFSVKSDADISKVAEQLAESLRKATKGFVGKPNTNEQRKAIIAEAKAFVAKVEAQLGCAHADRTQGNYTYQETSGYAKYNVNAEKRTVVALVHSKYTDKVIEKGIAKCAPDDVFNADIGKAIALGRALGLDVSRFEQAVKPTEVVVGQVVHKTQGVLKGSVGPVTSVGDTSFAMGEAGLTFTGDKSINGEYVWAYKKDVEINDDTEAVY